MASVTVPKPRRLAKRRAREMQLTATNPSDPAQNNATKVRRLAKRKNRQGLASNSNKQKEAESCCVSDFKPTANVLCDVTNLKRKRSDGISPLEEGQKNDVLDLRTSSLSEASEARP